MQAAAAESVAGWLPRVRPRLSFSSAAPASAVELFLATWPRLDLTTLSLHANLDGDRRSW
jgi:hypothetical protein